MTTNRPEFKAHDDFIFEHKEVGKVTREEFIKYIRSSHEHMRKLSQLIQQYNQTIDGYLNEWDGNLESFDDDVKDLLGRWIQDGTMDHIINENLMNIKADKEYVDDLNENVTAQLAHNEEEIFRKRELEDLSSTVLAAIEGGDNTNFNLLSIPQDGSVGGRKLSHRFTKPSPVNNLLDEERTIPNGYYSRLTGNWTSNASNRSSDLIACKSGDVFYKTTTKGYEITYWNGDENFVRGASNGGLRTFTVPDDSDIAYFRLQLHEDDLPETIMIVKNEPLPDFFVPFGERLLSIKNENIESNSVGINEFSSELTKTSKVNLLDETSTTEGGYYSRFGDWIESVSNRSSDLIACNAGDVFTRTTDPNVGNHVTYWDSNDVYVSGEDIGARPFFVVPNDSNIKYFRINIPRSSDPNKTMVVKGKELPSKYYAYNQKVIDINIEEIEDGSVTLEKLSKDVTQLINHDLDYIKPFPKVTNPVITSDMVTDREVPGSVADPFIVQDKGRFHMFFEVIQGLNTTTGVKADEIGHAYSDNLIDWTYTQIVLSREEHGHRSAYPHVFKYNDEWYMLPDVSGNVKLYKAINFPLEWEFQGDLLTGRFLDTNIFAMGGTWYMTTANGNSTTEGVSLYYNESGDWRNSEWIEHPVGTIIPDTDIEGGFRGAGNPMVYEDYVLLPIQVTPKATNIYGEYTYLYKIGSLSKTTAITTNLGKFTYAKNNYSWDSRASHHAAHTDTFKGKIFAVDGVGTNGHYSIGLYIENQW